MIWVYPYFRKLVYSDYRDTGWFGGTPILGHLYIVTIEIHQYNRIPQIWNIKWVKWHKWHTCGYRYKYWYTWSIATLSWRPLRVRSGNWRSGNIIGWVFWSVGKYRPHRCLSLSSGLCCLISKTSIEHFISAIRDAVQQKIVNKPKDSCPEQHAHGMVAGRWVKKNTLKHNPRWFRYISTKQ